MKSALWLAPLLILGALASIVAAGPAEDEISRIGDQRVKAYNEGNLEAVMAWFADDAVQTVPTLPFRLDGKDAIRANYTSIFQNFPTRLYVPRHRIARVYGDTAVTNTYFTLTLVDRSGKATVSHGRLDVTYVKQGGSWLVVNQHSSTLPSQ